MRSDEQPTVVVCSCERTMPAYADLVAAAMPGSRILAGEQFCGAELHRVRALLSGSGKVTIGCTQQAPLFREAAADLQWPGDIAFANIRENGGWSNQAAEAGPKAAALLALAAEPTLPVAMTTMNSSGVVLVYGRDETAIEAGRALAEKLDVTVLLSRPGEVIPPAIWEFPVLQGTISGATGYLGAFELVVDDFAAPAPSSRAALRFGQPRDGARSRCDLILDLSGGTPLFPAAELREGYLRPDPRDPEAVGRAIRKAVDLVGEFDKPRFIDFAADLCVHSRSRIIGCTRCLDVCPTGAITPAGNHVAIEPHICAGCGNCAAVCPTGAAAYALPDSEGLLRRVRTLLLVYARAGGRDPQILFHDGDHGSAMVDALARFGPGLPANVLPVSVNEITQLGIEAWTAPFAWGATAVRGLTRAKPKHDTAGLQRTITIANLLTDALGYGAACGTIETDDPDLLRTQLDAIQPGRATTRPATYMPTGRKRSVLEATMLELHGAAPAPLDAVLLPGGAPFGALNVNVEGCTLCLACVTACPTGALSDDENRPALFFKESACVQCGLCANTCPESVIRLEPRMDFAAWKAPRKLVKEEEPFHCISCGVQFGTRSTVERVIAKLEGKHWMFAGANAGRLDVIRMCDKCRVDATVNQGLDPYAGTTRAAPRTTDDYLAERQVAGEKTS